MLGGRFITDLQPLHKLQHCWCTSDLCCQIYNTLTNSQVRLKSLFVSRLENFAEKDVLNEMRHFEETRINSWAPNKDYRAKLSCQLTR